MRVNTNAGPGNFHMKPNGVFYLKGEVAVSWKPALSSSKGWKWPSPPNRD